MKRGNNFIGYVALAVSFIALVAVFGNMYLTGNAAFGRSNSFNRWYSPQTASCGDGQINQVTEQCDMTNLAGQTCQTRGFSSGDFKL